MEEPQDVWIIDTSSILQLRRLIPANQLRQAMADLDKLVDSGTLVFPDKVFAELDRWENPNPSNPDLPLSWTKRNRPKAARHGDFLDALKEVLQEVPDVCDPDKVGVEEADPYVLALALHLARQGRRCTVITEERKDRPDKMSLTTACGVLRLPALPLETYLARQGVWKRPKPAAE
jgi:hypothetical protein